MQGVFALANFGGAAVIYYRIYPLAGDIVADNFRGAAVLLTA
ncbi:MAG: hypothetical protein ACI4MQ_04020 [Candidatus Coproplasma sp.]